MNKCRLVGGRSDADINVTVSKRPSYRATGTPRGSREQIQMQTWFKQQRTTQIG